MNVLNRKKGFTLVEVIVVLVILAILAVILIPSLIGYIDKSNEKAVISEAREIYEAAQTAVSEYYASNKDDIVNNSSSAKYTNPLTNETVTAGFVNDKIFTFMQKGSNMGGL